MHNHTSSSLFLKSGAFNKFKKDFRSKPSHDHLQHILGNLTSSSKASLEKKSLEMKMSQAQFNLPKVRHNSTARRNNGKFLLLPTETNTSYTKRETKDLFSPRKAKVSQSLNF